MCAFAAPCGGGLRGRTRLRQRLTGASMCDTNIPQVSRGRIVSVGVICIDLIATVASFPEADAKIRTTAFEEYCGGNAANASVASRRLGVETCLISAVGEDTRGDTAIEALSTAGVDVSVIQSVYKARTPFTYILVDSTTGTRTCIHTPALHLTVPFIPNVHMPLIDRSNVLMLDGRHFETARKCAEVAQNAGIPVILDAERLREGTEHLISMATGVVVKDALAEALAVDAGDGECAALVKFLDRGPKWVIATRGKNGCVLVRPCNEEHPVDGEKWKDYGLDLHRCIISDGKIEAVYCGVLDGIKVMDSTGAGDAFFGALAYNMVVGDDLHKCIAFASVVAALSCEGHGAQSSPTREHVIKFLSSRAHVVGLA